MVFACLALIATIAPTQAERVGRLAHPAIAEASGLVASRRHPGNFWVHNDSGNAPAIYAVRADGRLVREYRVDAPCVDWEDIAADESGHLYLGDIGNNGRKLPIRAIYRFEEPDPQVAPSGPIRVDLASYYRAGREGRFDAEGLYLDRGRAMVVEKTREGRDAVVYEVPLDPPAPLFRPVEAVATGTLQGFDQPVTGADLSPDGRLLAVCSLHEVRVFRREGDGWQPEGRAKGPREQVEAVCWDGLDLLLASEGRGMFRVSEATWRGPAATSGGAR